MKGDVGMKRIISLLLVLAMLLSVCTLFAACDNNKNDPATDDDDDKTNEEPAPSAPQTTEPYEDPFKVDRFVIPEEGYDGSEVLHYTFLRQTLWLSIPYLDHYSMHTKHSSHLLATLRS